MSVGDLWLATLPLRRLVFFKKLFLPFSYKRNPPSFWVWWVKSLFSSFSGVTGWGEVDECAVARTGMGDGAMLRDPWRPPGGLCLSHSCLCLSGPGTANPAEIRRDFFGRHSWKIHVTFPKITDDEAKSNFHLLFLGEGSWTQRRKRTYPRSPKQLVAEPGLECRDVVLCSYCTSLLNPQPPKRAAAKNQGHNSGAFSVPMHATCLDFCSHL